MCGNYVRHRAPSGGDARLLRLASAFQRTYLHTMDNTRRHATRHLARIALLGSALPLTSGCSSSTEPGTGSNADLPVGWENAKPVTGLVQVECAGAELDFKGEGATFVAGFGKLDVTYDKAHFRCEQSVEGYFQTSEQALEIIVQPVDMNPSSVARCDCAYGITLTVQPLEAGEFSTTLFRRWDSLNEPNDPVEIASELVTIE